MPAKAKTTRAKKKEEELPFKITDHLLVPKHELMAPDESAAILKKYNASPHEFPFVLSTDAAGETIYYRYVVEA
jgi:DNA-directed RNA polymerase subunit H (RpoH/RPB5)